MQLTLTPKESEDIFHTALCNGLSYFQQYDMDIEFKAMDYKEAKSKLTNPCYEDVLLQILKDGNDLTAVDHGGCDMTRTINIHDVHHRVQTAPFQNLLNMIEENDDANDADVILQTVFFSEIVFG